MNNRSKKLPKFGASKMFTPNLGYKRIVPKTSDEQGNIEVKTDHDTSAQSSTQKQKKDTESSTTQVQSLFSSMSSTNQGRPGSSRMELSSGFRSYSNKGGFNSSGSFVKTEVCQSIQQMQMLEINQFDGDDPVDNIHEPMRLPSSKKDTQIKSENSLDYPYRENVYPTLSELMAPETLTVLQFYDSSFSIEPKITDIDLTENGNNDIPTAITDVSLKSQNNGHTNIISENGSSQPIGKVQVYESGRVVLIFNGKEYELIKANEDKHHKELFSLTNVEDADKTEKLVSLGTMPLQLKSVLNINSIIENLKKK